MAHRLDWFRGTRIPRPRRALIMGWLAIIVVFTAGSGRCRAARLDRVLTPRDRSQRIVLDQNGNPIAAGLVRQLERFGAAGSIPTYAAFPLHGGERLPAGLSVIGAGPAGGVGPLDFSQTLKAEVDAALAQSRAAEVVAPAGNYLIAILPGAAAHLLAAPAIPGTTATTTTTTASSNNSTLGSGLLQGPLGNWLNSGTSKLLSWTNRGLSELETLLELKHAERADHLRARSRKSSLNLEAQVLSPPPEPAPIPEPGTWVSFGIILVAVATTGRWWNRNRAESGD